MSAMHDPGAAIEAARRAVVEACVVCRAVQEDIERVRSITKDDRSPVTVADFASQSVIAHRLSEFHLGGMGVSPVDRARLRLVGEENADVLRHSPSLLAPVVSAVRLVWPEATDDEVLDAIDLGASGGGDGDFWTLDPIDGTKGFLRGEQYAVSLAFIQRGVPTIGLLGCPNLSDDFARPFNQPSDSGLLFIAAAGRGVTVEHATVHRSDAATRIAALGGAPRATAPVPRSSASMPSACSNPIPLHRAPLDPAVPIRLAESVEKAHSSHDRAARILNHLGTAGVPLRLDSQCKYAVVARGQADAYLRIPTKKGYVERIWDHAAGAIVATEAGCFVTDIRGRSLDFGCGRGLDSNLGVVCAPAPLHAQLIEAIRALQLDRPPTSE